MLHCQTRRLVGGGKRARGKRARACSGWFGPGGLEPLGLADAVAQGPAVVEQARETVRSLRDYAPDTDRPGDGEKLDRLWQEEQWYLAEKGRPATPEELAAELGIDVEGLAALRLVEADVESLDRPVPGDEDEPACGDLVEDPEGAAFAQRTEDRQWLAWILAGLDERSRRIVEWRFGHGLTFDEIARREDASREWVRRIAHAGLETLRQAGAG